MTRVCLVAFVVVVAQRLVVCPAFQTVSSAGRRLALPRAATTVESVVPSLAEDTLTNDAEKKPTTPVDEVVEEVVQEEEARGPRPAIQAASLVSDADVDYAPLVEHLRRGDFSQADQFTRDNLIRLAGPEATKRGYVYFTEAKRLPDADLATMELLWNHYSDGKFGYTVQKKLWRLQKQDFEKFCSKIGWNVRDEATGLDRKRRWFGTSEFIYDLDDAPRGHLPLTSALRGTQLLKALLNHHVWENDDWMRDLVVEEA